MEKLAEVSKSPEPIIEEPSSPKLPRKGIAAIIEEAEHFDDQDESSKPKTPITEEVPKRKPSRAKTLEIQEIEQVDNDLAKNGQSPKSPEVDNVQVKFKKGKPAVTEEAEVVEISKKEPSAPVTEDAEASVKVPKKGKPATLDSAEAEETITKYEIQTDAPETKKSQGRRATIEEAVTVEQDETQVGAKKHKEDTLKRQDSQKAKKSPEGIPRPLFATLHRLWR